VPVTEPLSISFDTPFDEAIAAATTRGVVLPDVYYGLLTGVARQLAFSIAGIAAYDQLQAVRDSLARAMATGQSFREWKKGVAVEALGLPAHRIENIWRTNLQGNYMRGRWEQFVRNADRRPYLIYNAINDTRVRPSHLAMDGIIRRWDDPLWRVWSPPAGYRSIIPSQPVSCNAILGLKAFYSGPAVEVIGQSGGRLTVTAQHPILTSNGWMASDCLKEGDELACYSWEVRSGTMSADLNKNNAPTMIEEVFETLGSDIRTTVPRASVNLYGDIQFIEGDVEVVGTDRRLMSQLIAECAQFRQYFSLPFANQKKQSFSRLSPFMRVLSTSSIFRGLGGSCCPFLDSVASMNRDQLLCSGHVQTALFKEFGDGLAADMKLNSDLSPSHSGFVHLSYEFWNRLSEILSRTASKFIPDDFRDLRSGSRDSILFDVFSKSAMANPRHGTAFINAGTGNVGIYDVFWNWLSSFRMNVAKQFGATDFCGFRFGPFDSRITDDFIGDMIANPNALGAIMNRHPGLIKFDKVVSIKKFLYSGHVYDLETKSGNILAYGGECNNHYVLSNCRCSLISLSESQARSRSGFKPNGTGTGINKQPLLDDGTPAQPDPGWDYNPYDDQLDRLAELAEERGVEPPKPWGEQVTPWQDQRLRYQAKLLDTTVDALETKLQADIEAGMQRQSVWISGTRGMVEDLIKEGAVPQVGSSTSANLAELQAMLRFDFEKQVLGEAIDRASDGITYGHLSELQHGTIRKSITLGDVSIKLVPSVASRTRVAAAADIFNLSPENGVIPSPMLKPSWRSARITARIGGLPDLRNLEEPTTSWSAMISGKVGIDDIEKIVFEKQPPQALQAELNRLNIRWEVVPADYDPLGPLDDEIPFHSNAHSGCIT